MENQQPMLAKAGKVQRLQSPTVTHTGDGKGIVYPLNKYRETEGIRG